MIPSSPSRPFGRPSPRLNEVDLAKIIERTIRMAVDGKRQLGFAAVTTGCDGRRRTTFLDGSSCQVEGEVCVAERQDGISACLEVQMQGSGIEFRSISFAPAPCSPATGWYVLDDAGNLYRIPAGLVTPTAPYWPPSNSWDPAGFDLVRAGTWARLMCGAALTDPTLQDDGTSTWALVPLNTEENVTAQIYSAAIGGLLTHLVSIPSVTAGTSEAVVGTLSARWSGLLLTKGTTTTVALNGFDVNSNALVAGEEYKALIYARKSGATIVVEARKGVKAAAGAAALPTNPFPLTYLELGVATVPFGGSVSATGTGTDTPVNASGLRTIGAAATGSLWALKGLLVRDADAPNAGRRWIDVTLPSATSGVVSGQVRIAWGYPLALEIPFEHLDEGAPFAFDDVATPEEKAARDPYDMAFVYPARLGIEYGPYHLNVAGPEILYPNDSTILALADTVETARDIGANILQLPNGEIALSRPFSDNGTPVVPQVFERYRVRPAPDTPLTVATEQLPLGDWGDDPNAWDARVDHQVVAWLEGDTSFTLTAGSWTHGRPVACVVWQQSGTDIRHTMDATAKLGVLGEPTGGVCAVAFDGGGGAPAPKGVGYVPRVTVLGPGLIASWGWTFEADGVESALSPITEPDYITPPADTYSIKHTVPLGPSGTTRRRIYRLLFNREYYNAEGAIESRWDVRTSTTGAVYDRMMALVATIDDNVTTEWYDEVTTRSYAGQRPPSPFIGPIGSGLTLDTTPRVVALAPLNL